MLIWLGFFLPICYLVYSFFHQGLATSRNTTSKLRVGSKDTTGMSDHREVLLQPIYLRSRRHKPWPRNGHFVAIVSSSHLVPWKSMKITIFQLVNIPWRPIFPSHIFILLQKYVLMSIRESLFRSKMKSYFRYDIHHLCLVFCHKLPIFLLLFGLDTKLSANLPDGGPTSWGKSPSETQLLKPHPRRRWYISHSF